MDFCSHLPQCCHGDNGVPKGCGDTGELAGRGAFLRIKHNRGKDNDGHGERKEEEAQLGGAALQGVAQDAQPSGVPGELENPKNPEDSEGDESTAHLVVVGHHQADVVRHDGDHVDDAHHTFHELVPAGRRD